MYINKNFRASIGKKMDKYLRENIGDENAFDIWLTMGIPDRANENDYQDLIEDDEYWTDCLEAFVRTILADK